ncbi:U-box domain-containing protein 35-like [Tripterygium wilfordii]|uniref:U-box domain-containing protein 35-like n=1 Tax=Tripterygium wilfordii TaxID=458696 RepID=UPI0018F83598|nr:U-box domain-containing protein 35-like [Tripterygium wilfordii]
MHARIGHYIPLFWVASSKYIETLCFVLLGVGEREREREREMARKNGEKKEDNVAVAIDKDKGSQYALKWAVDHLLSRGQSLTLLHVKQTPSGGVPSGNHVSISDANDDVAKNIKLQLENQAREIFLPFRCFCTRKDIKCNEIILEDMDIAKVLIDYVSTYSIEILVLGAPSRGGLVRRFKTTDVPSTVSKASPDFCTVYVISKGKISSVKSATGPPPTRPPRNQITAADPIEANIIRSQPPRGSFGQLSLVMEFCSFSLHLGFVINQWNRSPFNRGRASITKSYELSTPDSDISFVSSGRPSTDRSSFYDPTESGMASRLSISSDFDDRSFASSYSGNKSIDMTSSPYNFSLSSQESGRMSSSSQSMVCNEDDVEAEMRRLRQELKQTMDMYSSACKEALTAKEKARELYNWKLREEQKLEESRLAEEAALALAEKEKAKCKAAIEAAEAAQRIAELEAQKRMNAEMKAQREAEERHRAMSSLAKNDIRYRKYTIEEIEEATEYFSDARKIGEGGYGPVYKTELDHTPVAIKVLRPDAAQGQSQFQQEVEVLSCIRHPNMVLLLGACPEYGCLVYEYMANGSLDDRLFRRGNTPVLPWQLRFRIAAEIGTGLLFLHQTKPEPLVHRDLKPGNILLDRNFVSKISDVGLARLVPPSVANTVTQYRMTSTAGTFCYIDPEYQQTGMLGIKSDIYSLGIMLLQIITTKPPMGLTHHVQRAIEKGTFPEILDQAVTDWPVEEALKFAKLALQCAELRRKDRPDLGKVVLPELNRLRALAEESNPPFMFCGSPGPSPNHSQISTVQVNRISSFLQIIYQYFFLQLNHTSWVASEVLRTFFLFFSAPSK